MAGRETKRNMKNLGQEQMCAHYKIPVASHARERERGSKTAMGRLDIPKEQEDKRGAKAGKAERLSHAGWLSNRAKDSNSLCVAATAEEPSAADAVRNSANRGPQAAGDGEVKTRRRPAHTHLIISLFQQFGTQASSTCNATLTKAALALAVKLKAETGSHPLQAKAPNVLRESFFGGSEALCSYDKPPLSPLELNSHNQLGPPLDVGHRLCLNAMMN